MPETSITDEELSEVLGTPPSLLVRFGNTIMLLLILILAGLAIIIRYPDYIDGTATVQARSTTLVKSPPYTGRLDALFVQDGEKVNKGKPLCTIIGEQAGIDTIKAPASGVIEFQRLLQPNDHIDTTAPLFFVRDSQEYYKVEIQAPLARSGNIRPGQTVYIAFEQFPAQEYGEIEARILSYPVVQTGNKQWVTLEATLHNGLQSTNGRWLAITSRATGQAYVVLNKKSLITRLWPL